MKRLIEKIDKTFLNKKIQKRNEKILLNNHLNLISEGLEYSYISFYNKSKNNLISSLCDFYGSDKGSLTDTNHSYSWSAHSYADYYSQLFSHCRNGVRKVFECGLGTNNPNLLSSMGIHGRPGASLRVWRDYFPNAEIYGGDIDKEILFSEERIQTYFVDQLDPTSIQSLWSSIRVTDFDLIIDDGLHTFEAGSCLFSNSIDKLEKNGIYIIEDVTIGDAVKYKNFFSTQEYSVHFLPLFRPNLPLDDNILIEIRKMQDNFI